MIPKCTKEMSISISAQHQDWVLHLPGPLRRIKPKVGGRYMHRRLAMSTGTGIPTWWLPPEPMTTDRRMRGRFGCSWGLPLVSVLQIRGHAKPIKREPPLHSVSSAGDVNGDGYSDILLGASGHDNGELDEGRVWVYLGSPAGPKNCQTPDWGFESDKINGLMGASVSSAGDVNGDGYSDIIVGASAYSNPESAEGRGSSSMALQQVCPPHRAGQQNAIRGVVEWGLRSALQVT